MLRCLLYISSVLAVVLISEAAASIKVQGRIVSASGLQDTDNDSWGQQKENQRYPPSLPTTYESSTSEPSQKPSQDIKNILANPRIRGPVAVLVDTETESLNQAQVIWEETLDGMHYLPNNVILMAFNESEKERTLIIRNVENFRQAIELLPQSEKPGNGNNSGSVFLTVLKASQQIPPDSAVLVFTSRPARDTDLAPLAIETFIKKRCRVYVWWSASPSTEHLPSLRVFRQVAERTGGSLIPTYDSTESEDDGGLMYPPQLNKTIMAVRRELTKNQDIPIYIDSTVRGIAVTIVGNISEIHLQPPEGELDINLQDALDLWSLEGQLIQNKPALVEMYLNTSASLPGLWKLTITGDIGASAQDARYDVIVEGYSRLGFNPVNFDTTNTNALEGDDASLLFNVEGEITNVTGVTVLDQTGKEVKTAYYTQEGTTRRPDGSVSLELQVPAQELPAEPFYLQFTGHDDKGKQFSRLAYVQSAGYKKSQFLLVELADSSELFALPGEMTRLYFTVTNNYSLSMQVNIACRSKFSRFMNIQPFIMTLLPYQTTVHVVTLQIPVSVPRGSIDTIIFTASNRFESAVIPVLLYIEDKMFDYDKPTVQYTFQDNCKSVEEKNCLSKSWAVTATVQDKISGLLRIGSQPRGIRFDSGFTVGTKDPVTFTYSDTCCSPRLSLYIKDGQNNTAVVSLNAYDVASTLSEGVIAAIVLGIIILIIIIVIIVIVIVRKRQHKHTFQTHQTPH